MKTFKDIGIIGHVGLGTTIADVAKMKIEESVIDTKNLQEQTKEETSYEITAPPFSDIPKSGRELRRERRKYERKSKNKS